ncbi:MAG: ABC transporter substrate-binding protein [Oscillospiraceae bacterium]|nr:ABC transporter substrate-binding protein [Oscillospiraceae bacterium]
MKNMRKLPVLLLSAACALTLLAGCAKDVESPSVSPSGEPSASEPMAQGTDVRLGLLKGPTGMGAAKLLADNDAMETTNHYTVTLASDPANEIMPKLINGELDIAAIPTNLAATLYNKTDGGVQLLALNTLGVLYILENGDMVHGITDLRGKTVYATGQGANPEYVLNYLLKQNNLTPGTDVTVVWKDSDELAALMAAGEVELCMLPVPAVTAVQQQNPDVRTAVNLNTAWTESGAGGVFTMGCVVARTEFAAENPEAVDTFLAEYAASVSYANDTPEEAAECIAQYGITANSAIALAAIPDANMVCITGVDMTDIQSYYEVLYAADPTSIGGSIPDDAFYYIKK